MRGQKELLLCVARAVFREVFEADIYSSVTSGESMILMLSERQSTSGGSRHDLQHLRPVDAIEPYFSVLVERLG